MASDEVHPDRLRTAEATPIAKLSPAIADAAAVVVEGVVTVTWPYSVVSKSIAFILAERDPLHRRDKGQLRVEFNGAAGKALAGSGLGGGDEVRLSLDGARWEESQASMRRPGILEWQLRFSNRLLLKVRRADTHEVDTIEVDAADDEGGQEPPEQLREPSPTSSIELEHNLSATPRPRTPLSTIPQKRFAYETIGPGEYVSPAFIKRARVSYGSLFEGGFDIFDEEEPAKDTKKRKRKPRFSMNPTAWRYTSRSPTPEAEQEEMAEEEDEAEPEADVDAPVAEEQTDKQNETAQEPPASQPQPAMVDQGCQTRELSSSPTRGVQIIAESRTTGVLLQPTPTHPWKHADMDDVLQEPSPISFDFAATHDVHPLMHEPEPLGQPGVPVSHADYDLPMDIDPSLQPRQPDSQHHHPQPTYDLTATEAPPPRPQEPGARNAQLHGLAWVAEALAPEHSAVPRHHAPDFPQGSFDRSSYTLRASPSDGTHTLDTSGHRGAEMHGYLPADEAQRVSSSSSEQRGGVKPSNSYPERYEDDAETATVTATLGREGRSSPPREESSTDESEDDEDEATPHRYYEWQTGRWREGYPEEEDGDQRHTGYDDDDDEDEEGVEEDDEEGVEEDDEGEGDEDEEDDSILTGSEADSESDGGSEEDELEPQDFRRTMQPVPPTHRPYFPTQKPAPAPPKEPVFISLLSDDEDEADSAPVTAQPTQPKQEPSEERVLYDHDGVPDQPSEEEDEVVDEPAGKDVDEHIEEDLAANIDEDMDDYLDEDMCEKLDDAEEDSDIEEESETRMVATTDPSSRRSSRISQLDGADEYTEHQHEEPAMDETPLVEMDHANLILSPKADRKHQEYADVAEDVAQVPDELPRASSPSEGRSLSRHEFVAVNAVDSEEIPNPVMCGTPTHRSPEPLLVKVTSVLIEESADLPASENKPVRDQEQLAETLEAENTTEQAAEDSSIHTRDEPTEMTDAVEALAQHPTADDDLIMENLHSSTLEIQPSVVEAEVEIIAVERDVEMEDDVQSQLREEAETSLKEKDDQTTTDMASKATEEPDVAAPSSPPDTQREPSHMMPVAVSTLEEQEITDQAETTEQLPTPLETQREYFEEDHGVAAVVELEVPPNEEEADQGVDQDVGGEYDDEDEYKDADEGVNEEPDEDFEDAREGGDDDDDDDDDDGDDDDDLAIEQQLISESQHYSSPGKARNADRGGQASLQPPETIAEIDESQQSPQSQQQHTPQGSPRSQHSHHGHQHAEHCVHGRSPRRAGTEMSITLHSLRSHCRAKRMSSGSADSMSTDPSVLLARGSPTMAHRQCLIGDGDSLPQRSPRSPRNKAELSDPSVALARSSPRESVSPKEAGPVASLRARRGIRGSDASILLAQSFSSPSQRSPASPTTSFRVGQRKPEKPDLSVQLATASFSKGAQQPPQQQEVHTGNEVVLNAAHDDSTTPRRDATPEPTPVAGHNLRSPRKPTASSSFKAPSVVSSVAEDGNAAIQKLQLLKLLRTRLPDCLPLKSLRASLTKTADILAVATLTPRQPHRPKHGPRDYMLELHLTDPSVAPTSVNVAHIFRPHQASLPTVQAGDVVLLRRVQVVSMQGRGFGVRAGEASAWAVFEKGDEEMLPQIRGPPVEVSEEEVEYVQGLRRWWGLQDEKALAKIEKANQKMLQAVKDETK